MISSSGPAPSCGKVPWHCLTISIRHIGCRQQLDKPSAAIIVSNNSAVAEGFHEAMNCEPHLHTRPILLVVTSPILRRVGWVKRLVSCFSRIKPRHIVLQRSIDLQES
jgi:hypothetical protein